MTVWKMVQFVVELKSMGQAEDVRICRHSHTSPTAGASRLIPPTSHLPPQHALLPLSPSSFCGFKAERNGFTFSPSDLSDLCWVSLFIFTETSFVSFVSDEMSLFSMCDSGSFCGLTHREMGVAKLWENLLLFYQRILTWISKNFLPNCDLFPKVFP